MWSTKDHLTLLDVFVAVVNAVVDVDFVIVAAAVVGVVNVVVAFIVVSDHIIFICD